MVFNKRCCKVIGLPDSIDVFEDISEDEQASLLIRSGNKNVEIPILSDIGLRELVFNTKKAKARKFLKWAESEILPQDKINGDDYLYQDEIKNQPANVFSFQFKNHSDHEIRTIQKDDSSV